jgi:hypothetical protein
MSPSTLIFSEPIIGTELTKIGKEGGSRGLREEDHLLVPLTLLI